MEYSIDQKWNGMNVPRRMVLEKGRRNGGILRILDDFYGLLSRGVFVFKRNIVYFVLLEGPNR